MARPIQPSRAAAWKARRYAALNGRVKTVRRDMLRGHWVVDVIQRWHRWRMWYPPDADGLDRAERQRRNAEALR